MKTITFQFETLRKTVSFGRALGRLLTTGDIVCLDGDLGAGKTTLTQAIAQGLDVKPQYYVSSPTFNILHEYPGREMLYHMDFFRLHNSDDVIEMGLEEYFYLSGITVIEWSNKAIDILPETRLSIYLQQNSDQTGRIAVCSYSAEYWQERIDRLPGG
jgi:tRNA threonylcarbamoyladenosine biosynthesis protein TsaE